VFVDEIRLNISMNTIPGNGRDVVNITDIANTTQGNHNLQIRNGIGSDTKTYSSIPRKGTEANPGVSCDDIFSSGFLPSNDMYWINAGSSKLQVYCDMSTDEGGWTLAAVCKASNPTCWNANSVGNILNPNTTSSGKLSDSNIKAILTKGENITRTYWNQTNRSGVVNPVSAIIFNRITTPNLWTSASCGATNDLKEFFVKYNYAGGWGSAIYTNATTCSCSSNGWSNTQKDSCGFATWYAGCESGPSMRHSCADPVERADIVVWIR
ncbi:MAG: fibrinogen-like YCDxxxxGGGW domain-containing protein, partial [Candidatus Aenigmatarchaeota archaeon]